MAKYKKYKPKKIITPKSSKVPKVPKTPKPSRPKRPYKPGRGVGEKEIIYQIQKEIAKAKSKLRTLEKNGLTDGPFYRKLKEALENKEFSVAGKDLHDLLLIHAKIKSMNAMVTSKKKGAKEWHDTKEKYDKQFEGMSDEEINKIDELYRMFIEEEPFWLNVFSPTHLYSIISEIIQKYGDVNTAEEREDLFATISQKLDDIYESMRAKGDFKMDNGFSVDDL